jgi:hypothetical protein
VHGVVVPLPFMPQRDIFSKAIGTTIQVVSGPACSQDILIVPPSSDDHLGILTTQLYADTSASKLLTAVASSV